MDSPLFVSITLHSIMYGLNGTIDRFEVNKIYLLTYTDLVISSQALKRSAFGKEEGGVKETLI